MEENIEIRFRLPATVERELRRATLRPSWESSNEGVHERVNFDDTIWGFSLAGGAYYDTPLRITEVKPGSRAEKVGIRIGDMLKTINGVDTSTLTIQEAHDLIINSGIKIKLGVEAPDVEETVYFVYQDELDEEIEEARRLIDMQRQRNKKVFKGARTKEEWDIIWPCNKKRDVMYRESNCFLVPSRYEEKHQTNEQFVFASRYRLRDTYM